MRATWRALASHRDLRLVLSAGLLSRSGDWILVIGLLYRVYAMTGSTVASALTILSATVPQVVLGPLAGVFADRWDRKRTMVIADLLLAAGLLPLLAFKNSGQVWIVFAVLVWEGTVQQFFSPAEQAIVPRLVPDGELLLVNALNGQVSDLSRLAGSGLGGVIAAIGGVAAVTLADAASFVASAVLLLLVKTSGKVARDRTAERRLCSVFAGLREGMRLMSAPGALRALMIFALITGVGEGVFGSLLTPFTEHVLHGTSEEFGLIAAAQAIGGIAGGVLAATVSQRVSAVKLLTLGAIGLGVADLAIFLYPLAFTAVWPAIAGMVLAGLPAALSTAGMITVLQRASEDSYRGRLFGTLGAVSGIAALTGTLAAGYLSRDLGIIPVISIQGAVYVLAGLGVAIWLRHLPQRPADLQAHDVTTINYEWRGDFDNADLNRLHAEGFDHSVLDEDWRAQLSKHSLGWACATQDGTLVGFVNVAWDGGTHAFILDTLVAADARRQGIGTELVKLASERAREAGCEWLHVDFEDHLTDFYYQSCGFRPTNAGLVALER